MDDKLKMRWVYRPAPDDGDDGMCGDGCGNCDDGWVYDCIDGCCVDPESGCDLCGSRCDYCWVREPVTPITKGNEHG